MFFVFFKTRLPPTPATILLELLRSSSRMLTSACCPTLITWTDIARTAWCLSGCRTPSSLWWALSSDFSLISKLSQSADAAPVLFLLWFGFGSTMEEAVEHLNPFSWFSSSLLIQAQRRCVFLTMWLSYHVNHSFRLSCVFPGEFTLLHYSVWMTEQMKYGTNKIHPVVYSVLIHFGSEVAWLELLMTDSLWNFHNRLVPDPISFKHF